MNFILARKSIYTRIKQIMYALLITLIIITPTQAKAPFSSIAFYYGTHAPVNALHAFDIVVVEPDEGLNPRKYNSKHSKLFAYVSVGEFSGHESYSKKIHKSWIIGYNKIWKANVVNQANPQWQQFFLTHIIGRLWKKGYRGFLLDTLDSYQLAAKTEKQRQQQINGLVKIIREIKARYPTAKLILNRGFELLPKIHQLVYAVAAESLYDSWDNFNNRYIKVNPKEHNWLLNELNKAKSLGLPIIVIDYAPPSNRQLARKIAAKIQKLGFIPWVADGHLESLGIGSIEVIPRKVLILYSRYRSDPKTGNFAINLAPAPLNYLGYSTQFLYMKKQYPTSILRGRYAGILVWAPSNHTPRAKYLRKWSLKQIKQGVPSIFFDHFGFPLTKRTLLPFGIQYLGFTQHQTSAPEITHISTILPFDKSILPKPKHYPILATQKGKVLLQLENKEGAKSDMVAITPWGGYALHPYVISNKKESIHWVINPVEFFQRSLHPPTIPIPQITNPTRESALRLRVKFNPKNMKKYQQIMHDFAHYVVAKKGNGWLLARYGKLKRFMIPKTQGFPDLADSHNIVGYRNDGTFYTVLLGPDTRSIIELTTIPTRLPFFYSTNSSITAFKRNESGFEATLQGKPPLHWVIANDQQCTVTAGKKTIIGTTVAPQRNKFSSNKSKVAITVSCKNCKGIYCTQPT